MGISNEIAIAAFSKLFRFSGDRHMDSATASRS
jgi:hypothetical protein